MSVIGSLNSIYVSNLNLFCPVDWEKICCDTKQIDKQAPPAMSL